MRKTKIVCTLGLASDTKEVIESLMNAGMDVARFNFSHGTHESHKKTLDIVKKLRKEKNIPVATLLDTKGPEIRLGLFEEGKVMLEAGDEFVLYTKEILGDQKKASISYPDLVDDIKVGDSVMIDDGLIELEVKKVKDKKIYCEVIIGGVVADRKGVNIPGVTLSIPYISQRDKEDIAFGVKENVDFIAASFVRSADDVVQLREYMNSCGGKDIGIIAKIENADGVENIDEILHSVEGIMVARGDMGVEVPFEVLPALQKVLIKKCYQAGKMVITATQMLESMVQNPRPTRAEVSDVANAVYDGTSAVMLSGETAAGKYPVLAVDTMAKIVERTEADVDYHKRFQNSYQALDNRNVTNAISHATCTTAFDLDAAAVITVTISGRTARNISKYRPNIPVFGCTTSEKTYHQLALSWGVYPVMICMMEDLDDLFESSANEVLNLGYISSGDLVVITTGVPLGVAGTTNLLKVHVAGDVLVHGKGIGDQIVSGKVCVARSEEEALRQFSSGDILVINKTSNNLMPILRQASGLICEEDGMQSHGAIVGLTLEKPVLVGAVNATNVIKNGTYVTMNAKKGVVSTHSMGKTCKIPNKRGNESEAKVEKKKK